MAVTKVGSSAPAGSTGAVTLSWPAGHQTGDLAIIYLAAGSGSTYLAPALPSGCIDLGAVAGVSDGGTTLGNGVGARLCYMMATSSSMADLSIADAGSYVIAAMTVFRGVDQTSPILASNFVAGPLANNVSAKAAAIVPDLSSLSGSTLALLVFAMGDALLITDTTFGTVEVDFSFDAGSYEGSLFSAIGSLEYNEVPPSHTVTRASTLVRSNYASGWIVPRPEAVSPIAGNTDLNLTASGALRGTGALLAATTLSLTPAAVPVALGDLAGNTAFSVSAEATPAALGTISGNTAIGFTAAGALAGAGTVGGNTNLVLGLSGTGIATDGHSGSLNFSLAPAGTLTAVGTLQGATSMLFGWSAQVDGKSYLTANTTLILSTAGSATGLGRLQGSTGFSLTASAIPKGTTKLGGSSSLALTPAGTLANSTELTGNTTLGLSVQGALQGLTNLAGNSTFSLAASATPVGANILVGGSVFAWSLSGDLAAMGTLQGSTSLDLNGLGTGRVVQPIYGSTSFGFNLSGTLVDLPSSERAEAFVAQWSALFVARQALLFHIADVLRGTHDGIIDTYFDTGAPIAGSVGDLWQHTSTKVVRRWDGISWQLQDELDGSPATALGTAADAPSNAPALADGLVRSFWATEPPMAGAEGDVWFDTNDGVQQFTWDGDEWISTTSGITVYAQDDAPVGDLTIGDLWVETDNGNKMFRWDGVAWVAIDDQRIQANADAVAALTSRVTITEDAIESVATDVVSLTSSLEDQIEDLEALALAQSTLSTQVSSLAGSKAQVFVSPTMPSTSGRTNGDLWIDSDDSNRMYVWESTEWVARADQERIKVFAQDDAPSSLGRVLGDLWFDTDDGNKQYRWDGDSWENITDSRLTAQAAQITALQAAVSLLPDVYVQDSAPTGGSYVVGDMWFDSDDGNKQYVWNGTAWDDTGTINGATVYAQTGEPIGGSYNIGDLWIDTDDNNRIYRWNGGAWVDVSDSRIGAQGSAISALTTRVDAVEGVVDSQASAITSLNSSVASKAKVSIQPSAPTSGMSLNDIWIDTGDNNKLYNWNGSSWVLRTLDAGSRTFYQSSAPSGPRVGDLWVDTANNNLLKRWNGSTWVNISDARIAATATAVSELTTRVSATEDAINTHTSQITALNTSLSLKNRVFVDPSPPATANTGDLWIDTNDSNKIYTWSGANWIYRPQATGTKVFAQTTAPATGALNDLWVDTDDGNKLYRWNGSAWVDTTDTRIAATASAVSSLTSQVASKTTTFVQSTAPPTAGRVIGDLWVDTANLNQLKAWNGGSWSLYSDGTKISTFAQTTPPSSVGRVVGDLWADTDDNNRMYRWDGSTWAAIADTRIAANASQITSLNSAVAGKADVSAVNSLTTRIDTLEAEYGVNLVMNPSLAVNDSFWDVRRYVSGGYASVSSFIGERDYGAVAKPAGRHIFHMQAIGTVAAGSRAISFLEMIRCEPNTAYIYSGWGAQDRLSCGELRLFFYTANGTHISEAGVHISTSGTVYTGGTNAANWKRVSSKVTSPANAAFMAIAPNLWSDGGPGANARWYDLMIEKAAPGQNAPSPYNTGALAAWAEWSLKFDINGHISGMNFSSDGHVSNFIVNADSFQVLKPAGGPSLTWSNGHLWNKGTDYSVIVGQDMTPEEDVIMWIGPNPTSPEAALKEDAAMFIMEDGTAVFRGTLSQSLITGSAFELGSTRIHTGGGRLAPFTLRDFAYRGATGSNFSATVTLADFQSPDVGTGYHFKRFSRKKADVVFTCHMHGDGSGGENVYIEVQYDGGTWQPILSKTGINVDYRGGFTFLVRYTTAETWNTVSFRARTTNANTICLAFAVEIDNTYETGNAAGTNSGMNATGGGGGSPPPPGGGGGGGGTFCLVADRTWLPEGYMLRDARLGAQILCWDNNLEEPGLELHALRKKPFGYEQSYLVVAADGAEVAISASTPTPVRDGRMLRTPDLLGEQVLTNIEGVLAWSEVVKLTDLGVQRVVKPDVGDRVLFAGTTPKATIATHNIRDKDFDIPN